MAGPNDDAVCVARCLKGDVAAFETLVRRYQRVLYSVAIRLTGNAEDAQDVTQNAFIRAYERLETYDPARRFFSWIYRIAVNESLNFLRVRRPHDPLEDTFEADELDDPVEQKQIGERVQEALMALSKEYREVVVLRYFGELTYEEIGETIGIPEKTVKSRLFSARQRLAQILSAKGSLA